MCQLPRIYWRLILAALLIAVPHLTLDRSLKAAEHSDHLGTNGLTGDLVFARLLESNRMRDARLQRYSVPGTYRVTSSRGSVRAESHVMLHYRAPATKEFTIVAESGSGLIRNRVFKPLMDSEVETAAGRFRDESSLTPDNYTFTLLAEEVVGGTPCFVLQAKAKRADKYLFNGKVWVHASEYAVVRIAGQPVKNPSVWIKSVEFIRQYQKVKGFWLPLRSESVTQIRLFGTNKLTIDYDHYEIEQFGGAVP